MTFHTLYQHTRIFAKHEINIQSRRDEWVLQALVNEISPRREGNGIKIGLVIHESKVLPNTRIQRKDANIKAVFWFCLKQKPKNHRCRHGRVFLQNDEDIRWNSSTTHQRPMLRLVTLWKISDILNTIIIREARIFKSRKILMKWDERLCRRVQVL